ncbi:putative S-adenosyl-L-methionine-dependent methyltransferase [Streptomyces hygroscopicus subsp. hygroscopicus]|uniref:class I SAM-dependent methyltransferase n=1 Tax=Streptomyces sp. KHY 26 TaxID=3097359 RepID=UPI0024A418E8|nr:class I SAM-dependent methyltransferase [Streptomyces hygroscopicus]GLX53010.1 putative S-adenosyl-L-methionine-dependent methyltransferase [Streptomyces hygroscopicus subsp. hygroscopicus]
MRTAAGLTDGVARGVGRTALLVAAARAIETHRPDALARDPFAEHFVRAASASAGWPVRPAQVPGGDADPLWGRLGRYFALRTRVLDDHLLRSAHLGARQVVLLGAGLDCRAYRLDWPQGCVVYEVDTAAVLAFKQTVLDRLRATPVAERRTLAADLRDDWADALVSAGFDAAAPTAWLAEGLLLYLPAPAERRLVATVDRLSAADSTLAYEIKDLVESPRVRSGPVYTAARRRLGVDLLALFATGPRPDSAADLTSHGWTVTTRTPYDFTRRHGRGPLPEPNDALAANRWIFAAASRDARGPVPPPRPVAPASDVSGPGKPPVP